MSTDQISNTEIPSAATQPPHDATTTVAAVVIGRNEGVRLRQCLESLANRVAQVIYVDSGSTDGSCEMAVELGVQVVSLDLSIPFTAARARNEGMAAARWPVTGSSTHGRRSTPTTGLLSCVVVAGNDIRKLRHGTSYVTWNGMALLVT